LGSSQVKDSWAIAAYEEHKRDKLATARKGKAKGRKRRTYKIGHTLASFAV
jgi:hypothetical protein